MDESVSLLELNDKVESLKEKEKIFTSEIDKIYTYMLKINNNINTTNTSFKSNLTYDEITFQTQTIDTPIYDATL